MTDKTEDRPTLEMDLTKIALYGEELGEIDVLAAILHEAMERIDPVDPPGTTFCDLEEAERESYRAGAAAIFREIKSRSRIFATTT